MILELHIIQNFAPANLNRDDTGSPKDCEFGGHRRARISSQCLKRAVRAEFKRKESLLPADRLAVRTKRIVDELAAKLIGDGRDEATCRAVAVAALAAVGIKVKDDGKTEYLLFMGQDEINTIASICNDQWAVLVEAVPGQNADDPKTKKSAKQRKKEGKDALPPEVKNRLKLALDGGRAADLALFGRMLADLPEKNSDAACQVAHAISTNRASMEFDYYTAVDDLKPDDTQGADMLGTVEFNSSCFYRYANVDIGQLSKNLGGDAELTRAALEAFLRASVLAIPTGKQNSMAARNLPSLVMAVVRPSGCWSLANAFLRPVRPSGDLDLAQASIAGLDVYWRKLVAMYGAPAGQVLVSTSEAQCLETLKGCSVEDSGQGSLDALVRQTVAAAVPTEEG